MQMAMMFDPQNDAERAQAQAERAERERERAVERAERERDRAMEKVDRNRDSYRRGMSYLDRRDYDHAIQAFNQVIENKTDRADGALYWRAYAQNKVGKRDDALAAGIQLLWRNLESSWQEGDGKPGVTVRHACQRRAQRGDAQT